MSPPEITAQQKFACPACGAQAEWNPSKQALVCPYCLAESPATRESATGEIVEHDLVSALNKMPEEARGWQTQTTSVKCQSCQAITVFDPKRVAQRCDFCGSPALIPAEQVKSPIRPESVLEFRVAEPVVREKVRSWYGSRWFAPNALNARALTDTVHGLYIPYWTFDAQVHAEWTAESGYHYYETESYTDGQGRSQTRQVQHTRWQSSAGALDHFFDDEMVPASRGVDPALLTQIEPFPTTTDLKPYDPAYLSGWIVEQYQTDLVAAAQRSRDRMESQTRSLCDSEVPGDTSRNLQVDADFSGQTFKHILVPIWLVAYTYGSQNYQVVVNGYTGAIAGKHPLSWIKITLAVLAALIAIFVVLAISQR